MSEEQTKNILRWLNKLNDTDPILQGVMEDEEVLYTEHKNSMLSTNGHKQLQEALQGMGLPETGGAAKLNANQNSRHGWVPHTLIYSWLQETWQGLWTPEDFWNMILHTTNECNYHCYMVKYIPHKKIVMIKATKNKRKLADVTEEPPKSEDYSAGWGRGDNGGGKSYGKAEGWTNPGEGKPKQQNRYDAQGRLISARP